MGGGEGQVREGVWSSRDRGENMDRRESRKGGPEWVSHSYPSDFNLWRSLHGDMRGQGH